MARLFGYARVSTSDQDLTVQREALNKAGVNVIFAERVSGTSRDKRDELLKVLQVLGPGDGLVVTRLDRLGRSLRDLANLAHEIVQTGGHLKVLEQHVDTSTSAGRAFFGMLSVFAAFETDVRRERQMEGIAKAKSDGRYKGAAKRIDRELIASMDAQQVPRSQIAAQLGISRRQVYRILHEIAGRDGTSFVPKESPGIAR